MEKELDGCCSKPNEDTVSQHHQQKFEEDKFEQEIQSNWPLYWLKWQTLTWCLPWTLYGSLRSRGCQSLTSHRTLTTGFPVDEDLRDCPSLVRQRGIVSSPVSCSLASAWWRVKHGTVFFQWLVLSQSTWIHFCPIRFFEGDLWGNWRIKQSQLSWEGFIIILYYLYLF